MTVSKISQFFSFIEKFIIIFATIISIFISVQGVFFRYVLHSSKGWVEEVAGMLLLVIVLIGMSAGVREKKHMKVDLMSESLSPKKLKFVNYLVCILSFGTLALLFVWGISYVRNVYMRGITLVSVDWIPLWVPVLIMPIGFGMTLFRYIERFNNIRKGNKLLND